MKKTKVSIPATIQETREEARLMLHTQLAEGKFGKEKFRLIQSLSNTIIRMEYRDRCLDIRTEDLGKAMLDAIAKAEKGA